MAAGSRNSLLVLDIRDDQPCVLSRVSQDTEQELSRRQFDPSEINLPTERAGVELLVKQLLHDVYDEDITGVVIIVGPNSELAYQGARLISTYPVASITVPIWLARAYAVPSDRLQFVCVDSDGAGICVFLRRESSGGLEPLAGVPSSLAKILDGDGIAASSRTEALLNALAGHPKVKELIPQLDGEIELGDIIENAVICNRP